MTETGTITQCYHCGQPCEEELLFQDEKAFCCEGCKTVYEILRENDLCDYYQWDSTPGITRRFVAEESYSFLDELSIRHKLVQFYAPNFCRVTFFVPAIHCMSCLWLLENLQKLERAVLRSEVNFSSKKVTIDFNPERLSLSALARLMASVGYGPSVHLDGEKQVVPPSSQRLITQLAVAGFCFGNIMLLSFPEYLGVDGGDPELRRIFSWLNLLLAIPAVAYSGQDYFIAAWKSFRIRQINIDFPIAIGLAALFLRSAYDIISATGAGYLDSLAGLVFFLLIGRWFQSKTYDSLAFDRDYRSYFPLAVHRKAGEAWKSVLVYDLREGDMIRIRNMEIIPADCLLSETSAYIDYSFVTGESKPVEVEAGDFLYAGGRLVGKPATMEVRKKTSQSHLTSLWNRDPHQKPMESRFRKMIDRAARWFTWIVLFIALVTAGFWYNYDPSRMWLVVTSVLMVACPCALALAAPFTFGNMMRVMGKNGFYLKNADVIERMAAVNSIAFDKTGTVTRGASEIQFVGALDDEERGWIKAIASSSSHPLSNLIARSIRQQHTEQLTNFHEIPGKGMEAEVEGHHLRMGSATFLGVDGHAEDLYSRVYVSLDKVVRGYFLVDTTIRKEMPQLLRELDSYPMALLSGDNENEYARMVKLFPARTELKFNQSPHDKMHFVSSRQHAGQVMMMIGDGLNDAGALRQSDVGVAVTDDTGVFTPACDAILEGKRMGSLARFVTLSRKSLAILRWAFAISFFYNVIALAFAASGHLSPLVAAVLMPVSSISVVGFSTLAVNIVAKSNDL